MSVPPGMLALPGLQTPTPTMPQAQGMGAAIGADTYGVQHGPPVDEQDFAQRKEGFTQFLAQPQVQAFLLQAAAAMLSPRQQGESQLSHIVNGATAGAAAAGRVNTEQEKTAMDRAKLGLEQQRVDIANRGVDVQSRGVDVQEKGVDNAATHDRAMEGIGTQNANTAKDQADTDAMAAEARVRQADEQLAIERGKANNEAGVNAAEVKLKEAQAEYYRAAGGAQGSSGKASEIKVIAGAIKAKNPQLSDADAILRAQEVTSGTTRADRQAKMFKILKDNSMPGDDELKLFQQAGELVDQSLGVAGMGADAAGSTPPPIPPDVAAAAQPFTSAGATFAGQKAVTIGGKAMQVFTFKLPDGSVKHITKAAQ